MSTTKGEREITDFGKEVKKKLIDIDQTQRWLLEEVNKRTGLQSDAQYLNRVLMGRGDSEKIKTAISEILGIGS